MSTAVPTISQPRPQHLCTVSGCAARKASIGAGFWAALLRCGIARNFSGASPENEYWRGPPESQERAAPIIHAQNYPQLARPEKILVGLPI